MIASIAWLCEFVLEALGAYFLFRRKFVPLCVWLAFAALADAYCFFILEFQGYQAYAWADYRSRMVEYVLIAVSSVYVSAMILREHPRTRRIYALALCAAAIYAILSFHGALHTAAQLLTFEIWMELVLAGFIAMAMMMANGKAPKPWGLIACALVIRALGDLLVTAGRLKGWRIEGLYTLGEIVALGILCWAGWRDYRLDEIRVPLPKKKPATSILVPQARSRLVQ